MAKAKAKQKTQKNVEAIQIGTTIAGYLAAEDDTVKNIVESICQHLTEKYPSGWIVEDDVPTIVNTIADARGWPMVKVDGKLKASRTRVSRCSEVRAVIYAYFELPRASKLWREKSTSYTWHDAVAIARALPKVNHNVSRAVNAILSNKADNAKSKTKPRTQVQNFLTKFQRMQTRDKDLIAFRKAVVRAAKQNNLL